MQTKSLMDLLDSAPEQDPITLMKRFDTGYLRDRLEKRGGYCLSAVELDCEIAWCVRATGHYVIESQDDISFLRGELVRLRIIDESGDFVYRPAQVKP